MRQMLICTLLLSVILLSVAGGCGYTLEGRGSLLPPHILRVGIPTLDNRTTIPGLGETITSAIYSEFVSRGSFQVSGSDIGVDAVLEGEITQYNLVPRAIDEEGVATQFLVTVVADISFRDLIEDRIIWQQRNYRFQSEYQLSDVSADFVNQEAQSIELVAADFATGLVSAILTGF